MLIAVWHELKKLGGKMIVLPSLTAPGQQFGNFVHARQG